VVAPVRARDDFDALSRSRARRRSGPLWVVRADGADDARVAYAVPRKVGTAVVRNRVRRRLRAMMADLDRAGRLDAGLYLVGVRPEAADLDVAALRLHLHRALGAPEA
jgi:ribonuclease P protein component